MRWRRAFAAGLLAIPMLVAASPAGAIEVPPPYPIPPWCKRTITISPVSMHEGTVSPHDAGFTWFRFTVGAPGCILTGATVHYVTVHITTDGADLLPEVGTLTWSGGDLSSRTVYVKVLKDGTQEADERFALETLCPASGVDGGASAEGVVLNDDGGLPLPPLPVVHTYHCRQ